MSDNAHSISKKKKKRVAQMFKKSRKYLNILGPSKFHMAKRHFQNVEIVQHMICYS